MLSRRMREGCRNGLPCLACEKKYQMCVVLEFATIPTYRIIQCHSKHTNKKTLVLATYNEMDMYTELIVMVSVGLWFCDCWNSYNLTTENGGNSTQSVKIVFILFVLFQILLIFPTKYFLNNVKK